MQPSGPLSGRRGQSAQRGAWERLEFTSLVRVLGENRCKHNGSFLDDVEVRHAMRVATDEFAQVLLVPGPTGVDKPKYVGA